MKYLAMTCAVLISFSSLAIAAEDDFGAPFTNEAPLGLEDKVDALTIENIPPYLIEPAAGDEEDMTEGQDVQNTPPEEMEMPQSTADETSL